MDRKSADGSEGMVRYVFPYVDNYLVLFDAGDYFRDALNILKVFRKSSSGLNFTIKIMKEGAFQFLDLQLEFLRTHVCWRYHPCSLKPLLNFSSNHSKIIEKGYSLFMYSFCNTEFLLDKLQISFNEQVVRLKQPGYPEHIVVQACEKMHECLKTNRTGAANEEWNVRAKKKYTVIPVLGIN